MMSETEKSSAVRCRNCSAVLTGEYCSQCGQRELGRDLRFSDLVSDLIGEFLTWDSRIWRTLFPLLFRPGFLTAEFMAGRRARYVPPLRLYLIISFVLFLVLSLSEVVAIDGDAAKTHEVLHEVVDPNRVLSASMMSLEVDGEGEDASDAGVLVSGSDGGGSISIGLSDEDSPEWLQEIDRRMEENAAELQGEPGQFVEELLEYLPQMMFLVLPLFALLLKLCYLFSPYHYLQHLVFSLNYHSFVFLLYLIGALVERFEVHYDELLFLALLVYLPVGLWRVYGSGPVGAIGKATVIYIAYGLLLVFAFAAVSVLALVLM